jgi:hypothetical protein
MFLILTVLALFAASCGGSVDGSTETSTGGDDAGASSSSSSPGEDSTDASSTDASSATTEALPQLEGPAAPNFTLALEPSGEFVLSQEVKPVYMIFWAEW